MKRNWDLIREILILLEQKIDNHYLTNSDIQGYDSRIVNYHYILLSEAGLINTVRPIAQRLFENEYMAASLTWQGHEFLSKIHQDSIWNKVKSTAQSKKLDLSFDVIKNIAASEITAMLI